MEFLLYRGYFMGRFLLNTGYLIPNEFFSLKFFFLILKMIFLVGEALSDAGVRYEQIQQGLGF